MHRVSTHVYPSVSVLTLLSTSVELIEETVCLCSDWPLSKPIEPTGTRISALRQGRKRSIYKNFLYTSKRICIYVRNFKPVKFFTFSARQMYNHQNQSCAKPRETILLKPPAHCHSVTNFHVIETTT